jgi:PAS domain S-box-containing protein
MIGRLRQLLAPPVFPGDDEKTHAADLLNTALLTILLGSALYSAIAPIVATILTRRMVSAAALIGLLVSMLFVMRRGYVRTAAFITVAGCWAILTAAAYTSGGMRAPAIAGYLIVVLCAGLLLGKRAAVAAASLSALTTLAFVYAARAGVLPTAHAIHSDTSLWIANTVYLVVAAALLSRTFDNIKRALERARRELAERRHVESALIESEQRYRTLVARMSEGLIQVDNHDIIQFVNDRFCEMTGYTRAELLGKNANRLMMTSQADQMRMEEMNRRRTEGLADRYDILSQTKSGGEIRVEISGAPLTDASGATIGSIGVITNVTERRRAEQALREAEERYRLVSELVSDYAFSYHVAADGTMTLDWVTDAVTRITGYTREEISAPESWLARTPVEDRPIALQRRQRLHAGVSDVSEYRMIAKDGRILWLRFYSRPVMDATHGRVERVYGAVQDITKLKQLEQQLGQSQKLEAVGRLAGGIAHDFNNILTIILNNSMLVLESIDQRHPLRQEIEHIREAALRAAALTRQLLAFSRQQVLLPRILNLNTVVAAIGKLLRPLIGEDIELITKLEPQLGLVKADPGQIEQVIMNLAINARDAMPNGGTLLIETANVELDAAYSRDQISVEGGAYILLAISDTGSGMDAATQARIFEPFFSTKEQGKGTGLGLATVHGIVNQSGGHIWVYSEPGHGSSFKVYLPRAQDTATAAQAAAPAPAPRGTGTILLVEDEPAVRALAARVLRGQGYHVLEAADGRSALGLVADHTETIDLLLSDVIMPGGMSGRQLSEQLTQQGIRLKVLYMSGYTDDAITRRGVLDASVAFLQKPFTPTDLLRKVREVLET